MKPILRGVGICAPPFVTCPPSEPNEDSFPGEEVLFLRILAKYLGYTLDMEVVDTVEQMVTQVVNQKADITTYSLTADRLVKMNCTKLAYGGYDSYVFLMKGVLANKLNEGMVLQSFTLVLWLSILAVALLAWFINFVASHYLKQSLEGNAGLLITWLMISICLNCYGSLVSISAYQSSDIDINTNINTVGELLDSVISGSCRIVYNDEYGYDFFTNLLEPLIDKSKLEDLKFAFLRWPPILSPTRVEVKRMVESSNACAIAVDYSSTLPYFRIYKSKSVLKVFELPELPSEPYYYCINDNFPKVDEFQALSQSNQMLTLAERLSENSAVCFVDEGEESDSLEEQALGRNESGASVENMTISLAQISDCFELLWICDIIAFVCLMAERFFKSRELLASIQKGT